MDISRQTNYKYLPSVEATEFKVIHVAPYQYLSRYYYDQKGSNSPNDALIYM